MIKDTIKNLSLSATLKINEKSKVIEIEGKNIIDGNKINNIEALSNPSALNEYKNLIELKS